MDKNTTFIATQSDYFVSRNVFVPQLDYYISGTYIQIRKLVQRPNTRIERFFFVWQQEKPSRQQQQQQRQLLKMHGCRSLDLYPKYSFFSRRESGRWNTYEEKIKWKVWFWQMVIFFVLHCSWANQCGSAKGLASQIKWLLYFSLKR